MFDLGGRMHGVEAEPIVLGAVAGIAEVGREVDGNQGTVAIDDERDGLACLLLQIGEERGDGVEAEAVDGEDLVTGLEAGRSAGMLRR